MKEIIIYTTEICPYCIRAKDLFKRKGLIYKEINVKSEVIREEMVKKTGGSKTVPQIFINDFYVGGYDQLYELDRKGMLDIKLAQ